MTSVAFAYWLQGFFELTRPTEINAEQTALIQKHLNLVFEHEIDPSYPNQDKLNEIHNPEIPAIAVCESEVDKKETTVPKPVPQGFRPMLPGRGYPSGRVMC